MASTLGVHWPAAFVLAYLVGVLTFAAFPAGWRDLVARWARSKVAAPVLVALVAWFGHLAYLSAPPISMLPVARGVAAVLGMRLKELWELSPLEKQLLFVAHQGAATVPEAVKTAEELGLWRLTSGGWRSSDEVAELANVTRHGARCVLEILALAGLMAKDPDSGFFSHNWSSPALKHLVVLATFWAVVERPMVAHLTEAVQTGKAAGLHRLYGGQYQSLYHARTEVPKLLAWTNFMDQATKMTMGAVLANIGSTYDRFSRLLDVCGNEGTNSLMLARRYPQLKITVHDLPAVIEDPARGTRLRIREAKLEDRISVFAKDLTDDTVHWPPRHFDAVQLVHCVNEWSEAELRARLRQLREVLLPGGTLLVIGTFLASGAVLGDGVQFQMPYFLTATQDGGSLYTVEELLAALLDAGFVRVSASTLHALATILIAHQPSSETG